MTSPHASSSLATRLPPVRILLAALCAVGLAVAGCGDDDAPPPPVDAGTTDLGRTDLGSVDAGASDGAILDAGDTDAGPSDDAATPDTDGGTPDTDAGTPDTDAGAPDTDAGAPDAGMTMCTMRPRTGCCFVDTDCTGPRERCVGSICDAGGEGVCKADPPGADTCWDDKDCRAGTTCMSANICPCGAACFVADMPGVCVPTL